MEAFLAAFKEGLEGIKHAVIFVAEGACAEGGSWNQDRHALVHPYRTNNYQKQKKNEGPVHDQPLFHCTEN